MSQLEEIKARAEKATPGPWFAHQEYIDMGVPDAHQTITDNPERFAGKFIASAGLYSDVKDANAEFIAHARTDIPKLIAALEAVEVVIAEHESRAVWPDADKVDKAYSLGKRHAYDRVRHEITEALA